MKNQYIAALLAVFLCCISSFAQTSRVNFTAPLFYPEGTSYDPAKKIFFVSSVRTGTIGSVDEKGAFKVFYQDKSLKSSYGMEVDTKRNMLWVCTGDANYSILSDSATYKKMIRLIGLDLNTGAKKHDIDLSSLIAGKHFANDLAIDDKGNIYITDSYSPVVYKVDPAMKPSVFAKSDWFKSEDVGLNGIEWSPEGFLIVAHNTNGQLFKIDLAQPENISKVKMTTFFPGADGLIWNTDKSLVLIQNKGVNKAFQLVSKDKWQSAELQGYTLLEDRLHHPTTATMSMGKIYTLNSKMNELSDPTAPPSKEFSLQLVRFVAAK
ncbi:MAG: SMP-30/gluconolactonase/LRE family protein [Gemmatimonadaceae bacterium]|nr:SMP-30/gluconolactonase/LRE family protein [Chitinophagaceae bacterium]